jgi:hypothetical protein
VSFLFAPSRGWWAGPGVVRAIKESIFLQVKEPLQPRSPLAHPAAAPERVADQQGGEGEAEVIHQEGSSDERRRRHRGARGEPAARAAPRQPVAKHGCGGRRGFMN